LTAATEGISLGEASRRKCMTGSGGLPDPVRKTVSIVLVVLTGLAFAVFFAWAIIQAWASAPGTSPKLNDAFSYVSTAIAALVGGIVAVAFGLKQPPSSSKERLKNSLNGLRDLGVSQVLLVIYVVIYLVCGVVAIVTWVIRPPETPELVKNLAVTFVGMLIAITGAYFK
jgi:Na+-transporting methylmalonyl-CoA/oxaloacetate decarboxylase gamma subunit